MFGKIAAIVAGLIGCFALTQPLIKGEIEKEKGIVVTAVATPISGLFFDIEVSEALKAQVKKQKPNFDMDAEINAVRDQLNGKQGSQELTFLKNQDKFLDRVISMEKYLLGLGVLPVLLLLCGIWGFVRTFGRGIGLFTFVFGVLQSSGWFVIGFIQTKLTQKLPEVKLEALDGAVLLLVCGVIGVVAGLIGLLKPEKKPSQNT